MGTAKIFQHIDRALKPSSGFPVAMALLMALVMIMAALTFLPMMVSVLLSMMVIVAAAAFLSMVMVMTAPTTLLMMMVMAAAAFLLVMMIMTTMFMAVAVTALLRLMFQKLHPTPHNNPPLSACCDSS